jgi:hypothetical protein
MIPQDLPSLPEPAVRCGDYAGPPGEGASESLWDADQMRSYALAAVEAERQKWLPIESAPKDGTHILLANKAGVSEGGWLSDIDHGADWEGQIGMAGWWRTDGTDWTNTHWRPLPAAPSQE